MQVENQNILFHMHVKATRVLETRRTYLAGICLDGKIRGCLKRISLRTTAGIQTAPRKNLIENYCRNPDSSQKGTWCFSRDPLERREECIVPICAKFERQTEKIVALDAIILHPKYNWKENLDRDIALFLLTKPLTFTENIAPICLPTKKVAKNPMFAGFKGRVTGWGNEYEMRTSAPQSLPQVLQQTHLPIVLQETCRDSTKIRVTDNMFCAGFSSDDSVSGDSCEGDSGGPFVMKKMTADRIFSWGEGCDRSGKYEFYTRLFRMRRWMLKVKKPNRES
ncbi:prothrombin-like [Polyodon spathula]|uniref:prothrombin-like n=1 Tax=Polyodon spathula TaxID=7913 RepID=UPI001B7EE3DE|nr:prothrombin-like [Polyodon spathula]